MMDFGERIETIKGTRDSCTMLIHYKGKCEVLTGAYEDLKPRCSELLHRNINAEIV